MSRRKAANVSIAKRKHDDGPHAADGITKKNAKRKSQGDSQKGNASPQAIEAKSDRKSPAKGARKLEVLSKGTSSLQKQHVLRLLPGMEIKSSLQNYCKENKIAAAYVITCVGSVTQVHLRMAHSPKAEHNASKLFKQHFEIVSLVGTVSQHGEHLHMSLSGADGGHLMGDALVYTTVEIVLGEATDLSFGRAHCELSGWPELVVTKQ